VVVPDVEASPLFAGTASLKVMRDAGVRAVQSTPMLTRSGELIGILTTQWDKPYQPSKYDLWRIDMLVRQASDLIECARTDEALRKSKQEAEWQAARLKTTLDAAPAIIWMAHDRDCRCITGNRAAYEFLRVQEGINLSKTGPDSEPLKSYRIFHDGVELEPHDMPVQVVARTGRELRGYGLDFRFADGSSRSALGNVMPVLDAGGRPAGAIAAFMDITARKLAEDRLQNALQRFYLMLASMYSGVLLITAEGRVEFVNQAFCDAYGLRETPAELIGLASFDLLDRIDHAFLMPGEAAARIREILQQGQPVRNEEFAMQGGRTAMRDFIPLNVNGRSCGRLWIHTDITDRKQAEKALQLTDSRLQTVFDHRIGGIGIIIAAADGHIKQANNYYLDILGCTRDELLAGKVKWRDFTPPEWFETDERALARLREQGLGEVTEKEYMRRDGSRVRVLITAAMLPGEEKDILAFVLDITERGRMEEMLRKSEQRHRLLAETMLQGVIHQDAEGEVIAMNPAAEFILGRNREEILGSRPVDEGHRAIHGGGEPFIEADHPSMLALRTGLPVKGVVMGVFNPRLGAYRWLTVDAVPVFRPGETIPSEVYAVFEDITERRQAEMALQERTRQLEEANRELERLQRPRFP
jgi:PAS domain S-box-containing protein